MILRSIVTPLFPLTPALSLREREDGTRRLSKYRSAWLIQKLDRLLPLPKGEGRGAGEAALHKWNPPVFASPREAYFSVGQAMPPTK
jgi:hypothetical protein